MKKLYERSANTFNGPGVIVYEDRFEFLPWPADGQASEVRFDELTAVTPGKSGLAGTRLTIEARTRSFELPPIPSHLADELINQCRELGIAVRDESGEEEYLTVLVREYVTPQEFQQDAGRLAKSGWRIASTTERTQRAGAGRIATLGFGALLWKPKPHIVVTYERAPQEH